MELDCSNQYFSVFRTGLFRNKVALVTGGGTGIGYACARDLVALGCNVIIASRKTDELEKAAERLRIELKTYDQSSIGSVHVQYLDLSKPETIEFCVRTAVETLGRLDFLVNNAGGQFLSPAEDISVNGWSSVLRLCLSGTFFMCQAAHKYWMAENGGSIVNITAAVQNGYPSMAHSGAARAGVENLSKTLSLEWVGCSIRVNCVAPGIIWTDSGARNYGGAVDTLLPNLLDTIPAGRCGTAEEVCSAVLFLLSPGSAYITGTSISVDGGGGLTWMKPLANVPRATNLPVFGTLNMNARL